ncbi:flavin-dependent oxidoreductase [Frankia casuarinae]|jgi:alkanesulfonate monooxygenase SsuD/methylene tetrahydromethanopterin reductase-like flavin-dependent oxidoreductase (luciferase family)|uniref:Luciferase-like n=2 Tax=Frankia casuarinae (strain DSM 45818 / CECT 9043 / HFP020203 / CcI3) TaxID=106370 RepID=Q2JB93_FRACC|nr:MULTISPECIES: LLM class flavin-dependent oxidoreductase [Frankia]ABD11449.1 luciferase-like [Frankia casuarinae]ETA00362.1 flavin-dependent oxidoreductase [Frankia sp. CcI6]EYT89647.1 flavin-dependent oxidoreductase [Frankia casuarinae]KDA40674.1 flavin-dependent oxidoreductase [Frankia sp. BMG5.23]KFB02723.1 flavin-dependent oxidoreductase, methylene-tetrahydromethanopterin reductase [Frankia sp. Allo2]
MKFSIFLNPQVPGSGYLSEQHVGAKRPIGRDTDSYQAMLHELRSIAVQADQTGFDALMLSEHHFHSEGLELSVNPLMVLADLAARTERLLLAPLGMVLPAWDPVRAAEDVALLDQFCRGRLRLGLARGFQNRWVNVLGQRWEVTDASGDGSHTDDRNFEVFGEILKIMKMCWTQETVRYRSEILDGYSIPQPFDGIADWPAVEWTRAYGAADEIDEQGRVRAVSVCPRPYQDPYPELWQPFTMSDRSIVRCAQEDIVPWIFTPFLNEHRAKAELYQSECAKFGREYKLGEHTGFLKMIGLADTTEEAARVFNPSILNDFATFYGSFGFQDPSLIPEVGLFGAPDDVKRGLEKIFNSTPDLEWIGLFMIGQQGGLPLDRVLRSLELFAEEIIPEFRD